MSTSCKWNSKFLRSAENTLQFFSIRNYILTCGWTIGMSAVPNHAHFSKRSLLRSNKMTFSSWLDIYRDFNIYDIMTLHTWHSIIGKKGFVNYDWASSWQYHTFDLGYCHRFNAKVYVCLVLGAQKQHFFSFFMFTEHIFSKGTGSGGIAFLPFLGIRFKCMLLLCCVAFVIPALILVTVFRAF